MTIVKQILRWLAVVPGGLLAGLLITFPIHWAAILIHASGGPFYGFITEDGGGNPVSLAQLEMSMDALFVSGTVIAVGARIAPRFRFGVALILASVIVGFFALFYAWPSIFGFRIEDSPFVMVVHIILCLVSVISALLYAHGLNDEEPNLASAVGGGIPPQSNAERPCPVSTESRR
jgi:hypothetical protein